MFIGILIGIIVLVVLLLLIAGYLKAPPDTAYMGRFSL